MDKTNPILIAVISAGLASLVNCIFQLVNKLIDLKKSNRDNDKKQKALHQEKKEQVYIAALDRLLQIRRGFDYTSLDYQRYDKVREMFDAGNSAFVSVSPKLRLYASDRIFRMYQQLASWSEYALAPPHGPRLMENSKWAFDAKISLLAHLMQAELGYRNDREGCDSIQCPGCGTVHDIALKCPKCGMTFEELQFQVDEILRQEQEQQTDFEHADSSDGKDSDDTNG